MKKICIFILSILAAWNIQSSAIAGIDDTNNKVFTITPDKMLGDFPLINYEDSVFFPTMTNLVSQPMGLTHFSNGDIYSGSYYSANDIICEASDTFYLYNYNGLRTPAYYSLVSGFVSIPSWPYTSFNHTMLATNGLYSGTIRSFIISSRGVSILDYTSKTYLSTVTPELWSQPPHTFTIWKNRLFAAPEYNEVYFSKAGDFTNFGTASYEGGRFDIHPVSNIRKLLATNNGIYIFTSNGIYYLSGTTPTSWRLDKVSEMRLLSSNGASYDDDNANILDNNTVVFIDDKRDVYTVSNGYSIQKITTLPVKSLTLNTVPMGIYFFKDRFLVVTGFTKDSYKKCSYAYDLEKKCWYQWDSIITAGTNYYVTAYRQNITAGRYYAFKKNINDRNYLDQLRPCGFDDGSVKNYYQITLTTPYFTLDGNDTNYKRLKRIEIDCKTYKNKESAYYDSTVLDTASTNLLKVSIDTDRQTAAKNREFIIANDAANARVNLTQNATTYTMRFAELNEFRKIRMTFETTGGIIIKQIRFYYQVVGEK